MPYVTSHHTMLIHILTLIPYYILYVMLCILYSHILSYLLIYHIYYNTLTICYICYIYSDFEVRMRVVEKEKLPYTFTSSDLLETLEAITSIKTRIAIIESLCPRLMDPKARMIPILNMFRYSEERARVESALKARSNALSSTIYRSTSSNSINILRYSRSNSISSQNGGVGSGEGELVESRGRGRSSGIFNVRPFATRGTSFSRSNSIDDTHLHSRPRSTGTVPLFTPPPLPPTSTTSPRPPTSSREDGDGEEELSFADYNKTTTSHKAGGGGGDSSTIIVPTVEDLVSFHELELVIEETEEEGGEGGEDTQEHDTAAGKEGHNSSSNVLGDSACGAGSDSPLLRSRKPTMTLDSNTSRKAPLLNSESRKNLINQASLRGLDLDGGLMLTSPRPTFSPSSSLYNVLEDSTGGKSTTGGAGVGGNRLSKRTSFRITLREAESGKVRVVSARYDGETPTDSPRGAGVGAGVASPRVTSERYGEGVSVTVGTSAVVMPGLATVKEASSGTGPQIEEGAGEEKSTPDTVNDDEFTSPVTTTVASPSHPAPSTTAPAHTDDKTTAAAVTSTHPSVTTKPQQTPHTGNSSGTGGRHPHLSTESKTGGGHEKKKKCIVM